MTNPLRALSGAGQSVWLDYLHRRIIENGELQQLIDEGLRGVTSNPSIFEKALDEGDDYDAGLKALLGRKNLKPMALYETLAIADIQHAADLFRPTFERLQGQDGFVSLEVSPYLANDTQATIEEVRRLWKAVDRPNLMIKIPGTTAGVAAIRQAVGEGVNVNVTLLFAVSAYLAVAQAHLEGLEIWLAGGGDLSRVHGVASFFVSRIDSVIDKAIDARLATAEGDAATRLKQLRGKVAVSNAKIAYQHYLDLIASPRWMALARSGAAPQRLLWASTGTKDPTYSDVLYIENLIGPDTINTMPPKTLDAFRDHGRVRPTLTEGLADATAVLAHADQAGLDLEGTTSRLVDEGVTLFAKAFDGLLKSVADRTARMCGERTTLP